MSDLYHPWHHASDLGLTIRFVPGLPVRGTYRDGVIQLREGMAQRERRCTLAHEIVHHERGDDGTACSHWHLQKLERGVHLVAAQRLLTIRQLAAAMHDPDPAETLWVDDHTLTLRLQHLTIAERRHLQEAA